MQPAGWLSTGGAAGTSGGVYARTSDDVTFTAASGLAYGSLAFGDVPFNTWAPPGTRLVAAGSVATYAHRFTAGSAGSVRFRVQETPSPTLAGWSVQLVRDLDCSGTADAGEPTVTPGALLALAAGQTMCVIARHQSPAGAPGGASEQAALTASFVYTGAAPALTDSSALGDVTTVTATSGLVIAKSVDLTSAKPGDYLVFGRETAGIPRPLLERHKETWLRIPMFNPDTRSLNLSNCAALVLYEAIRQQGFPGETPARS